MLPLKTIEAFLSDTGKKSGKLRHSYEIAKDPSEWEESIKKGLIGKGEEEEDEDEEDEDIDMLAEDGEVKPTKASKKRKRTSDAATTKEKKEKKDKKEPAAKKEKKEPIAKKRKVRRCNIYYCLPAVGLISLIDRAIYSFASITRLRLLLCTDG